MFKKILIANRGEIALRVICACKELGIKAVAIYSEADRNSLHVRFADEAICIGPPRLSDSYLNVPAVISAAEIANVDAIHPGYGLLSENANFAEVVQACGIKFIGPPPEVTRMMGEKEKARAAMKKVGVPILPGSDGIIDSAGEAAEWARTIGYPVIVKASAGGGGRGMRIIRSEQELPNLYHGAQSEAAAAFGNGDLYMEKFIERPRHIEFQVLADEHGKVMSLGERECSIQRRHQKLVEEAPSVVVTQELRDRIGGILVKSLGEIGYVNAGTVEFLMDEDGSLHFIEMNTRIQVEHPVTEMTTDVDLVKSQIRIAAGEKLEDVILHNVYFRGHAIECRINAEHPEKFTPSAGKINVFNLPGGTGIRVDTAAYAEGVIPPYYDSLIAKLCARGRDREEAVSRMARALDMFVVEGIYTTIPLHRKIMADPEFRSGQIDTKFMERFFARQQEGTK
ncbi:MAG: acetyl-CoA carboxylase biotin carboxylase subunit [Candidatus Korobacteraceae bacterium]